MRTSPFKLLCGAGLLAIFSSTISKNPALPLFATHLGADAAGVGFVASVSAFTGIIASIPAGLLSDRIGRRRMLVAAALVFATAPFLYLFVGSLWQLVLVRFYHGFATAIFIPVAMATVADLFHAERGEKLGWFSTSTLAGRFAAPIAGGALIGLLAFSPDLGYRVIYLTCGAAGVLALIMVLRLRTPRQLPGSQAAPQRTGRKEFAAILTNRRIVITALVEAGILFAYGTFETFLPLYAIEAGLGAFAVGVFISSQIITLALTKPFLGRMSDRRGRQGQISAGAVLGAACIATFSLFHSFVPLLLLSILFGLSLSVVTSATSAFIADSSRGTHGSAMGVLGSVMDIGHTTGPLASGIVASQYGLGRSFLGAAVVLLVIAGVFRLAVR